MIWEISPCSQLSGRIAVPGSKSHTIRAVAAALLADGTSEIHAPLYSADTQSALSAVKALGAKVNETPLLWKISGCGKNFSPDTQRRIPIKGDWAFSQGGYGSNDPQGCSGVSKINGLGIRRKIFPTAAYFP